MRPSRSFPPLDLFNGVNPSQAASSCPARKPLARNVEYFAATQEALRSVVDALIGEFIAG